LKDLDAAVQRILKAITGRERILIFGDYDVDGVTATALLYEFLKHAGAQVFYYIPHRRKEGYSLKVHHIPELLIPNGIQLVITTDCGSSSHDAVQAAKTAGVDVVITDHHQISEPLPPAVAVVNPKRQDCQAGFGDLAGVGVAFYLVVCLRKELRDMKFWHQIPEPNLKNACDLVALGTVADMVPLVEENRILTTTGLQVINAGNRPGLQALIRASGSGKSGIDAEDIAFRLAPRLNAAGRIRHAKAAVELLMTKDVQTSNQIAQTLAQLNTERQQTEREILDGIERHLEKYPALLQRKTLVLYHPQWHEGILGIAAARMAKRHYRPVVLISTQAAVGRGSARSIPGFNLYEGLCRCSGHLDGFGGHAMAAGLSIKADKIAEFQKSFEEAACTMTLPEDFIPAISIDDSLRLDEISEGLIDELESLKPFGPGNPEPLFMANDVLVLSSRILAERHRRMILRQSDSESRKSVAAIQFNVNLGLPFDHKFDRIAYRLRWNRWNGKKTVQVIIEEAE
jgi:single-stranded-DNA-specific exonuclease